MTIQCMDQIHTNFVAYNNLSNVDKFNIWHNRLSHFIIGMIQKIINNLVSHKLKVAKFSSHQILCASDVP
jgi:hypothetical protein